MESKTNYPKEKGKQKKNCEFLNPNTLTSEHTNTDEFGIVDFEMGDKPYERGSRESGDRQ